MSNEGKPPEALVSRVAGLLGRHPTAWRRATGGYTTAERWIVEFSDGSSCFVKSGAQHLATFLRAEYSLVYSRFAAPFLPKLLTWDDNGDAPVLALEDLSDALWPPPWDGKKVDAVLESLKSLQAFRETLDGLPSLGEAHADAELLENWRRIEDDPSLFLSLGFCSESWLREALPTLVQASESAPLAGDDVLHLDVRSDNLCFLQDRAVLVDWNHVCRGNADADIAFWLPSLQSEGGPRPEEVRQLDPCWAAVTSGYFARRAGLPPIPQAPAVRGVQLSQLRAALPWAVRALGLPPLDGGNAPR